MMYLWVEDFDEGHGTQKEREEYWSKYFGINEYTLKGTLEDALIFLEDTSNHSAFDAVLIDIRFPILKSSSERSLEDIYETFYSKRITKDKFFKYAGESGGYSSNASAGILLFYYLILKFGYKSDDIVFLSANVDNSKLSQLYKLKELIKKGDYLSSDKISKFEKDKYSFSSKDAKDYRRFHNSIFENRDDVYETYFDDKLNGLEKREYKSMGNRLKIENMKKIWGAGETGEAYNDLCTLQEKISESINIDENEIKYRSVKAQFEDSGLKMPTAFEKPDLNDITIKAILNNTYICWTFKEWKDLKENNIILFRRSIIQICKFVKNNININNVKTYLNHKCELPYTDNDNEELNSCYYLEWFDDVLEYVANNHGENGKVFAKQLVNIIAKIWEKAKIDPQDRHSNNYYKDEYYGLLIHTRNWTSHQGILNIDISFAAFIFVMSVRSCFDVNKFKEICDSKAYQEYTKNENNLIKLIGGAKRTRYSEIIKQNRFNSLYADICKRVEDGLNEDGKSSIDLSGDDIYSLTHKLGDKHNKNKNRVSAKDLYTYFFLASHVKNNNGKPIFIEKESATEKDRFEIKIIEHIYNHII